jgi:hypothetical protein
MTKTGERLKIHWLIELAGEIGLELPLSYPEEPRR